MQFDLFAPAKAVPRGKWPSEQLADYLGGLVDEDQVSPAIKSWAAFYIHDAALQVCQLETKEKRRTALSKIPPTIRQQVQDEVKRIWPIMRP